MVRKTIVIALSVLTGASGARASVDMGPFDPVQDFAPPSIIFDDPQGQSFTWDKQLPCGANRATVTVKFDAAYHSDKWAPVAKVVLYPPHDGGEAGVSFPVIAAVVMAPTDPHKLNATVWLEKDIDSQSQGPGTAPEDLNAPLQINLAWTPGGLVRVNFGGEFDKGMMFSRPINRIQLSVAWAKFEFIGLKVGHAGPPDPACATAG